MTSNLECLLCKKRAKNNKEGKDEEKEAIFIKYSLNSCTVIKVIIKNRLIMNF